MKLQILERWREVQDKTDIEKYLPELISKSWRKSRELGISPFNCKPYVCTDGEFEEIKSSSRTLYIHSNNVLKKASDYLTESQFGFALIDKSGCLLKLYGSEAFLAWAGENCIEEKSIWDENIVGANAVSLGIKNQKPIAVIGEQHYSLFGINIASYFAPIIAEYESNQNILLGGVAVIGPSEKADSNFLITAITLSREIALQLFWIKTVSNFTNAMEGFMAIDNSSGKNHILLINQTLFKIFNVPYKPMYYSTLEELIDPEPKNKDFWDVLKNKTVITDSYMELSVRDKHINVSVTTRPYYASAFHIDGMSIIIQTSERINNIITKYTGNYARFTFKDIIGKDESFQEVIAHSRAAATWDSNILLLGESGAGKEVFAHAIHNASQRRDKPFVAINCAAFPKELISSELFGYDEGAFTGAKKGGNVGKFELANSGTIFLDEIGDMPLDLQATLLRVIEQKSFMKIGSSKYTDVNVRIIAATNNDLVEKIRKKEFREDLYYRLGVVRINIPPLRERNEDILILADHFIKSICSRINKPIVTLSPEVKDIFLMYGWPGNVRELQNMLEGIIQIYDDSVITHKHIKHYLRPNVSPIKVDDNLSDKVQNLIGPYDNFNSSCIPIKAVVPDSREQITNALRLNNNNKAKTAEYLGISRRTLYRRMHDYKLL